MKKIGSLRIDQFEKKMPGFFLQANFEIQPGERVVVSGPSGCGKTTLLRWICGVEEGDGGRVWSGNEDLSSVPVHRRGLGVVFQEQALFSQMTILENAGFGLKMQGMSSHQIRSELRPWLEKIGLLHRAEEGVSSLSGGEKQRLALVRALVWRPRALLLDEPFSAMDEKLRSRLQEDLFQFHQEWPIPILLISHDRDDVSSWGTREIHCRYEDEGRVRKF